MLADPSRGHRYVRDKDQLLVAVMDPTVSCVLVSQTIKLSDEGRGPEVGLISTPLYQVLSHKML